MDGENGAAAIVLAAEHFFNLGGIDFGLQFVDAAVQIGAHVLALSGPFDEHGKVFGSAPQRLRERDFLFEAPAALQQLLRLRLVLPEIGLGDAGFDSGQFLLRTCGLKDTLGDRRRAGRAPDTDE